MLATNTVTGALVITGGSAQCYSPLDDTLEISYKTEHTYVIQKMLLGIYSNKPKTYVYTKTFMQMFTADVFITAKHGSN